MLASHFFLMYDPLLELRSYMLNPMYKSYSLLFSLCVPFSFTVKSPSLFHFYFWYGFLTFMPLVALSYFQLYPPLPILIFLPYIKTHNTTLFPTLRVPLLTFLKICEKSNETFKVNRREYNFLFWG